MSDSVRNRKYYGLIGVCDNLYKQSKENKCFVNLLRYVADPANIRLAFRNIKRNGGSNTPGVDGKTVKDYETMTVAQLVRLVQNKLQYYVPKPVKRVEIPKSSDPNKTRPLGIPCFVDRLVQQCVKQVLEPILEAKFYKDSFGFRPNRGVEDALAVIEHRINFGKLYYVVDADIKGFFDNVNHSKLIKQLWTLGIRDKKLLCIIKAMLKAPILLPDKTKIYPDRGCAQGGVISPLLSLVVLNELDWWIASQWDCHPMHTKYSPSGKNAALKRSGLKEMHIVRYADDFKLICRTKEDAKLTYNATVKWLKERLSLDVSPEKSGITDLRRRYTDFLGFELKVRRRYPSHVRRARNYVVTSRIKRKTMSRLENEIRKHYSNIQHSLGNTKANAIRAYNAAVIGWHEYYGLASQASRDFNMIEFHTLQDKKIRLKDLSTIPPDKSRKLTKAENRYSKSGRMAYLEGEPLIPVAYARGRPPSMPNRSLCEYTSEGRQALNCPPLGIPEEDAAAYMLLADPSKPIELEDNAISKLSAQHGLCAITGVPLNPSDAHCILINPYRKDKLYRYNNLMIVNPVVYNAVSEFVPNVAKDLLERFDLTNDQRKKINILRSWRGLKPF